MAKKNKRGGGSLQDQLKAAGLVTEKQVRKAQKGIHRKDVRVKHGEADETKLEATQVQAEKASRDRTMNKQRDDIAADKALDAQVKQIIEMNRQRQDGDIAYNFTVTGKIKKIHISLENKTQLNKGYLAIVSYKDGFELVPAGVASKIQARREDVILYQYDRASDLVDEDDPYKDFQIPDDLEW